MRKLEIKDAVRRGQKARIAFDGPTGSGKTFTMLKVAQILAGPEGRVTVIDTENDSASLYADLYPFKAVSWRPPYDPRELAEAIVEIGAQTDVLDLDSLSHFWTGEGGTLDIVEAAAARAKGNSYAGWKDGTPAQNSLIDAIVHAPCHLLASMRSKQEYVQEKNERGATVIRKVGMAPIQREGFDYEFTVTVSLDTEHRMIVGKSRCSLLAGKVYKGEQAQDFARTLKGWLDSAEPAPIVAPKPVDAAPVAVGLINPDIVKIVKKAAVEAGFKSTGAIKPFLEKHAGVQTIEAIPVTKLDALLEALVTLKEAGTAVAEVAAEGVPV